MKKELTALSFWSKYLSMRIATWNINSVRLRIHHVLRFIKEQNIDVMCLQEAMKNKYSRALIEISFFCKGFGFTAGMLKDLLAEGCCKK